MNPLFSTSKSQIEGFNSRDAVAGSHRNPPTTYIAMLNHYGVFARHGDGVNVAFTDGHVKWMKLE